jgi:hypothetical protein
VEIARQPTLEMMEAFVERVAKDRLTRDDARRLRAVPPPSDADQPEEREKSTKPSFVVKLQMESVPGTVHLRFADPGVRKREVIAALEELIHRVESSTEIPD